MNAKSIFQAFSELSATEQSKLLAAWMHAVTIDARDTYIAGTLGIADPVRLRGFNELQHRIVGSLLSALDKTVGIDESFIESLWEDSKELRATTLRAGMEKIASTIATPRRQRRAG